MATGLATTHLAGGNLEGSAERQPVILDLDRHRKPARFTDNSVIAARLPAVTDKDIKLQCRVGRCAQAQAKQDQTDASGNYRA